MGQRRVVFITGEAGIGKTTLIQTFLTAPAAHQALVVRGQAVEQLGAHEPYLPVLEALGRLARLADPQHFVSVLRRNAPTWLAQMPWLLEPADAAALRQSLGEVRPERMLRELAVFFEEFASTATVILVLEDLHWSDPSTVELLLMLAQRSEPAQLLVIGTYRPAEASVQEHPLVRAKHTLQLRRQCAEIALEYLTRSNVETYLEQRFPGARFPESLAGLIHDHTDGTPLFMVTVVEQLLSRGWLLATDPGWALTVPVETLRLAVPDDLRDMIRLQFQGMGPADVSLLEAASVSGDGFTAGEIAQAIDGDVGAIETACEHLVRTYRFLRVADEHSTPADNADRQYFFVHALHRHVIYAEIPMARRRRLHLRMAAALEAGDGGLGQSVFRLAEHFENGGDGGRAITYLAAAAARALERSASREAIACFETALRLIEHLPDAEQRRCREVAIRIPLNSALNFAYGYASNEVRENCERTRVLCEQDGGSLLDLYEVLCALWYSQLTRAEKDTTQASAQRLVEIAEQLGSPGHRLHAASARGRTLVVAGSYQEASDTLETVVGALATAGGDAHGSAYGADPIVAAYGHCGWALWFLGFPDKARHSYRQGLALAQQDRQPFTLTAAHAHAAMVELLCGNSAAAFRLADQATVLATTGGFSFWRSISAGFRGWAQMRLGELDTGVEAMRAAISLLDSTGAKLPKALLLGLLAEGCLRLGNRGEGLARVDEGLQLTQLTLERFYEPELWRLKGELLLLPEPPGQGRGRSQRPSILKEAERSFECAMEMAHERGARSLELRAAMSLARLEQRNGKSRKAHDRLADLYGWFTEGHDTQDLQNAKTLLGA